MKYALRVFAGVALFALLPAVALANSASLSIGSLSPSSSVLASTLFNFTVTNSGFSSFPTYTITDSFPGSSLAQSDMNAGGFFSWVPTPNDVGTHTFTVVGNDSSGDSATASQSVTVLPPPSISLGSVSPGSTVSPGTTVSFTISQQGFTNPTYSIGDSFTPTTVNDNDINSSGTFSWTPDASQDGTHTISIYASDSSGHNSQASVTVQVGPGIQISLASLSPGATLSPGQTLTFTASPIGFSPTSFSVSDSFPGSSLTSSDISAVGGFAWTPSGGDAGTHVLNVFGQVGAYGQSTSTKVTITVLGPGGVVPTTTTSQTTTQSATSTALAALQSQLNSLEAQIAGADATSVTTNTPAATTASTASTSNSYDSGSYVFNNYIGVGSTGADVIELQIRLASLGFLHAWPTGYYGSATTAAVKAFQTANSIAPKGYVGPSTRAALNQQ